MLAVEVEVRTFPLLILTAGAEVPVVVVKVETELHQTQQQLLARLIPAEAVVAGLI
tara:strand:+ start:352 stop:519 length:168 start_codon:yes stop_codon:yes gene_type:complete